VTQDQLLLASIGALVAVNVLLVVSILVRARRGRRPADELLDRTEPLDDAAGVEPGVDPAPAGEARTAAAIEAFVAGAAADRPPLAADPPRGLLGIARAATGPDSTLADLADPAAWSRAIREESARVARFGHPATVVIAELPNLDTLADSFGRGVADRIALEAARLLVAEGREADRIARLGDARFGILLTDTEETAARGYVERIRGAIDSWLESVGLSTRLALGWASPGEGGDVIGAAATAEQRMFDARRPRSFKRVGRPERAAASPPD